MGETLGRRFMNLFRKIAGNILLSDEMKEKFIIRLNGRIDIPVLSEQDEAELFELIWDTMEETIKEELEIE